MELNDLQHDIFKNTQKYCATLENDQALLKDEMLKNEKMANLEWDEEDKVRAKMDNVKLTLYPGPKNVVDGVVRLMTATDAEFDIPRDMHQPTAVSVSDKIEQAAKYFWRMSGRITGDPAHYDMVRSAVIYGEVHAVWYPTAEVAKEQEGVSRAAQRRMQKVRDKTPVIFKVRNPRFGFPDFDMFGLRGYLYSIETTQANVVSEFGDGALELFEKKNRTYEPSGRVILKEWWDLKYHIVWCSTDEVDVIKFVEHGLSYIPVVCTRVEGSDLFETPEDKNNAFLKGYRKSGLWDRQNLTLTVLYSNIFGIGANPMFLFRKGPDDQPYDVNMDVPGGIMSIPNGSEFSPMYSKGVIDPSIIEGYKIAGQLEVESTMYKQSLGEPLGKQSAFSMVALLSQAGRLPLVLIQRKCSWVLSELMVQVFDYLKEKNIDFTINDFGEGGKAVLKAQEIPEAFEITGKLDIDLPQDKLQTANVANTLKSGDPVVSKQWIRENILNIGQSDQMDYDIWTEQASNALATKFIQGLLMQPQQQAPGGNPQLPNGMPDQPGNTLEGTGGPDTTDGQFRPTQPKALPHQPKNQPREE